MLEDSAMSRLAGGKGPASQVFPVKKFLGCKTRLKPFIYLEKHSMGKENNLLGL